MKYLFFCICFFTTVLCYAQYEFDYQPLDVETEEEQLSYLQKSIKNRLKSDLGRIHSENEKQVREYYSERTEWLLEHIEAQNFIWDVIFTSYVEKVLNTILEANPGIINKPYRILIDRNPIPNALCTGEGTLVVNLGLLRRIENESQLAFVVAHEMAHFELDHVNKNIYNRVEQLYGEKSKKELSKIRKSNMSKTLQALDLLKGIMYTGVRYSRNFELEADSLGLQLLKNTPYDMLQSYKLLDMLDLADYPKYKFFPKIDSVFNFEDFPFKTSWLREEETIFDGSSNSIFIYNIDSLKTHPDIKIRKAELDRIVNMKSGGQENIQDQSTLRWIIRTSDFEAIESAFFLEDYGRCLFLTLQGLSAYPDHSYLHGMIGQVFIKLYEARRDHSFGKYVPVISKQFNFELNEIHTFLHNLRLSEIGTIGLNYMNTKENFDKENEKHYFILWKLGTLVGNKTMTTQVSNAYHQKFPNGEYTQIIHTKN